MPIMIKALPLLAALALPIQDKCIPIDGTLNQYINYNPEKILVKYVTDVDKVFQRWYDLTDGQIVHGTLKPERILVFELNLPGLENTWAFLTFVDSEGCVYYQDRRRYWNLGGILGADYKIIWGEEREWLHD